MGRLCKKKRIKAIFLLIAVLLQKINMVVMLTWNLTHQQMKKNSQNQMKVLATLLWSASIVKQYILYILLHILSLIPIRYQHNMKTLSEVSILFHSSVVSFTLR